jgi:nucleotidyltransferase/DNA polymerase involved in DNA repair
MPQPPMQAYRPELETTRQLQAVRKIIHVDMDAFYASVEQRDNPDLRGKPLAVGGSAARGVVAAASYEARALRRAFGHAVGDGQAQMPDLIFVPPRFDVYKSVSQQIREVFAEYTPLIEPLSLDEAYLDVTENLKGMESPPRSRWRSARRSNRSPGSTRLPAFPTTSFWPRWPAI